MNSYYEQAIPKYKVKQLSQYQVNYKGRKGRAAYSTKTLLNSQKVITQTLHGRSHYAVGSIHLPLESVPQYGRRQDALEVDPPAS